MMILEVLRGAFILLVASVAALYVLPYQQEQQLQFHYVAAMLGSAVALGAVVVAIDVVTRRKKLSSISGVFLGLVAGLLAAYCLGFVVSLVGLLTAPEITIDKPDVTTFEYYQLAEADRVDVDDQRQRYQAQIEQRESYFELLEGVKVLIGLITCYISISLVLQTRDDFRFVIPYVEFAKQIRGNRPIVLDTSILVDGRIVDIMNTNILQGSIVVPRFVLDELQTIADSADKLKRARGRRGLDMLAKLQASPQLEVTIDPSDPEGAGADQKLITLTGQLKGKLMTNDFNLGKIAHLRNVDVISLNDLATALRPVVLPGESMVVQLVKPGENPTQGVGYLEDGTMIVVEGGRSHLDQTVALTVTSTLQTSAGRMIFGRFDHITQPAEPAKSSDDQPTGDHRPTSHDAVTGRPSTNTPPRSERPNRGRNPRRG